MAVWAEMPRVEVMPEDLHSWYDEREEALNRLERAVYEGYFKPTTSFCVLPHLTPDDGLRNCWTNARWSSLLIRSACARSGCSPRAGSRQAGRFAWKEMDSPLYHFRL